MKRKEIALAAAINEIWQPKSKLCTSPKSLDLLRVSHDAIDIYTGTLHVVGKPHMADALHLSVLLAGSSPPGRKADPYGETGSYDRR